ncbi:MAG TPA: hypothetical protein VGB20_07230 [bacterium]
MLRERLRSFLLGGALMALGWSLRGQFGHLHGALIPGACAAGIAALAIPNGRWRAAYGWAALFALAGFAVGGHLSYGRTIESVLAAPGLRQALPGLIRLWLIGAVWGGIGMTFLGFGLSERKLGPIEAFGFAAVGLVWWVRLGWWNLETEDLLLFWIGLVALHAMNAVVTRSAIVEIFGFVGALAFGFAFAGAVLLHYAGAGGWLGSGWHWWSLRDQMIGLAGGFALVKACRWAHELQLAPSAQTSGRLGWTAGVWACAVAVPWINVLDVLASWRGERSVAPPALLDGLMLMAAAALGAAGWLLARAGRAGSGAARIPHLATLVLVWSVVPWAIAKELVPMGPSRWEPTYLLFLILGGLATLLLVRDSHQVRETRHV